MTTHRNHFLRARMTVTRWFKWLFGRFLRVIPEAVLARILPAAYSFDPNALPPTLVPPATSIRLFIGPANYAGQGWQWARAVERNLPNVGAVNMVCRISGDFRHPADQVVSQGVYAASRRWQHRQRVAVLEGFTHVLIEAEKQPFGAVLDESVLRQAKEIDAHGLGVIMVCHGTDIRLPSRHRTRYEDSPFNDTMATLAPRLEATAARNRAILDRLGFPVLVTTPDLILDVPYAHWLPSIVHLATWHSDSPPLLRPRPIVAHAPSAGATKGSELIDPILTKLNDEGLIAYRRITRIPFAEMPEVYREADIVVDQVRLGDYDVVALEAMAAGRVVVGHVSQHTREHVKKTTGLDVPVVETRPSSLERVVREIVADRARFQRCALDGEHFVSEVHDGRKSAEVLSQFLL